MLNRCGQVVVIASSTDGRDRGSEEVFGLRSVLFHLFLYLLASRSLSLSGLFSLPVFSCFVVPVLEMLTCFFFKHLFITSLASFFFRHRFPTKNNNIVCDLAGLLLWRAQLAQFFSLGPVRVPKAESSRPMLWRASAWLLVLWGPQWGKS